MFDTYSNIHGFTGLRRAPRGGHTLESELKAAGIQTHYVDGDLCFEVRDESTYILRRYPLILKRVSVFRPSNGNGPRTYRIAKK